MEKLRELVFRLCGEPGLPGEEKSAAALLAREIAPFADRVETDANGNVFAWLGQQGAKERVLLDAHMDQVGLIVTRLEKDGRIAVDRCGGVDRRVLPGAPVLVHGAQKLAGVVAAAEHPEKEKSDRLWVDCGRSGEELGQLVSPGDRVTLWQRPVSLLGDRISCAALDDRCGCAVLIRCAELLKEEPLSCEVVVQFSTLEEIGCQGAGVGAYRIQPTRAVAVDVSFASQPGVPPEKCGTLGGGPMIGISPVLDGEMSRRMVSLAQRDGIPYSCEVMGGETSTNGDRIAVSRSGVSTALLSVPLRNMHTAAEVIDLRDVERTAQLLASYLKEVRE